MKMDLKGALSAVKQGSLSIAEIESIEVTLCTGESKLLMDLTAEDLDAEMAMMTAAIEVESAAIDLMDTAIADIFATFPGHDRDAVVATVQRVLIVPDAESLVLEWAALDDEDRETSILVIAAALDRRKANEEN